MVAERESQQIYESMKSHNQEVTYILFSNEGHDFAHFSNKMMYFDQAELFLSQYLQGKHRPSKKELLAGSTARILN